MRRAAVQPMASPEVRISNDRRELEMSTIEKSVGRGGVNRAGDVKVVQGLLNLAMEAVGLSEDGTVKPHDI